MAIAAKTQTVGSAAVITFAKWHLVPQRMDMSSDTPNVGIATHHRHSVFAMDCITRFKIRPTLYSLTLHIALDGLILTQLNLFTLNSLRMYSFTAHLEDRT